MVYKLYTVLCIWHGFKNENIMKNKVIDILKNNAYKQFINDQMPELGKLVGWS